jgi:hypothetical protein
MMSPMHAASSRKNNSLRLLKRSYQKRKKRLTFGILNFVRQLAD